MSHMQFGSTMLLLLPGPVYQYSSLRVSEELAAEIIRGEIS